MRFALLLHYPQRDTSAVSDEMMQQGRVAFQSYAKSLDDAGVLRSAEVLDTIANATSVRVRDGKSEVRKGPAVDSPESYAGSFVIDVADLESAVKWAEKCPAAQWGTVEVRPVGVRFENGAWRQA